LAGFQVTAIGRFWVTAEVEWVVIRTQCLKQAEVTDREWKREQRWIYYDRQTYRIYAQDTTGGHSAGVVLTAEGKHGLAGQNRVPLVEVRVTDGLWLMNKAALLQLEHFNKSNALAWALTMGLFATPVVYSDKEWSQIMGDSYYIQLAPGDRFGWTEPEGHVFQIASDNLTRLKDEIYRVCYLMNQAGGPQVSPSQSGLSKQRDFGVTQEILRSYGDTVKEGIRQVLQQINLARQDEVRVDVSGLDEFDIGDFGAELDDAKRLLDLGIQSDTLKQQLFKRLALKYFCDIRQDVKTRLWRRSTPVSRKQIKGGGTVDEPVRDGMNVETIVQRAVQEYMRQDVSKREPAYKAELQEERRRREQLEKRLNDVVAESQRNRKVAEEAERTSAIRTELQKRLCRK